MAIIKTQGIVIKYTNINESDRILTILTRNKGKIQAIAKGCRKPKSRLLAVCEMFTVSELLLYKGKSFYHISQGDLMQSFFNIRNDLVRLTYATYFAELAEAVSDEEIPSDKLFVLLAKCLYYLSEGEVMPGILNLAYELKLMDISGFRPSITRCASCGETQEVFNRFHIEEGGVVCDQCNLVLANSFKISPGTMEFLKLLYSTEISRLNRVKIDNTIFSQMEKIIKAFIENHLDKKFKALDFLDELK